MCKKLHELAKSKMNLFPENKEEKLNFILENGEEDDITYFNENIDLSKMDTDELKECIRRVNYLFELENENEVLNEEEVIEKTCEILNTEYGYYVSNSGAAIVSEYIIMRAQIGDSVEDIVDNVVDEIHLKKLSTTTN